MDDPENLEAWAPSLMELPEVIQELIFSTIWKQHGRIDGIHPDFGRVAYLNSPEISDYYWVSTEGKINLLMNLIDSLRNGDHAMK